MSYRKAEQIIKVAEAFCMSYATANTSWTREWPPNY